MSDDVLSQDEISALLEEEDVDDDTAQEETPTEEDQSEDETQEKKENLSSLERDAIGETGLACSR